MLFISEKSLIGCLTNKLHLCCLDEFRTLVEAPGKASSIVYLVLLFASLIKPLNYLVLLTFILDMKMNTKVINNHDIHSDWHIN